MSTTFAKGVFVCVRVQVVIKEDGDINADWTGTASNESARDMESDACQRRLIRHEEDPESCFAAWNGKIQQLASGDFSLLYQ